MTAPLVNINYAAGANLCANMVQIYVLTVKVIVFNRNRLYSLSIHITHRPIIIAEKKKLLHFNTYTAVFLIYIIA